jgi:hypothetical protein
MKRNKEDLFYKLMTEGYIKISGLNKDFNSYRIIKYKEKEFKLTLEVLK